MADFVTAAAACWPAHRGTPRTTSTGEASTPCQAPVRKRVAGLLSEIPVILPGSRPRWVVAEVALNKMFKAHCADPVIG